jgi:septum site-determining protein MinC
VTAAALAVPPDSPPPKPARKAIRFRARSFIAFALAPELPIVEWLADLDEWTKSSPDFFVGRPVVLDLAATTLSAAGITHLISQLAERGIRIMGLEGVGSDQINPTLPPLLRGGRQATADGADKQRSSAQDTSTAPSAAAASAPAREEPYSLIVTEPVRSGQSVVFPNGDVTVVGSVASGAEVVAGGSIHIHGTLRGRAMAGASGNAGARIFCRKNEAELFAIDGYYQTAEEMDSKLRGQAVQAFLEDGLLQVAALD